MFINLTLVLTGYRGMGLGPESSLFAHYQDCMLGTLSRSVTLADDRCRTYLLSFAIHRATLLQRRLTIYQLTVWQHSSPFLLSFRSCSFGSLPMAMLQPCLTGRSFPTSTSSCYSSPSLFRSSASLAAVAIALSQPSSVSASAA